METPSFKEDHISQIPALQLLQNMGWVYLTPEQALMMRGNKTSSVILEDVLRRQLKVINAEKRISSTRSTYISDANIEKGILALKELPMNEGYIAACEAAYNLLTLGKALEQSIDGDKKSFTLQYIDWQNISNNAFNVTEEFSVMRSGSKEHYRPDIVLFVNGIPLCIIECKRPDLKEPLAKAISQHLRNQQEDGIRLLYAYSQLSLSLAMNQAAYATNGSEEKFWAQWEEKFQLPTEEKEYESEVTRMKNTPLKPEQKERMFSDRFRYVRNYFDAVETEEIQPTKQDKFLHGLCRPKRLLDFTFNFVLFDAGVKKIARYQQFFAIKKTMQRITKLEEGRRKGGVIWHTQGSGKSLTMVMLAQAIALDKSILNPKIILVTDRVDLDDQITGTFQKCGKFVENATTGQRLIELLESKSDAVVTTIINKFEAAVNKAKHPFESHDIFVLIDEGHRTQYGSFNVNMQRALPNACFIAFTGTPLMKREKSTALKFGGIIDTYTVDKAVRDEAVVPILYEGRHAYQKVNENPIDNYFKIISEPLTEYQRADLKRKFSRADQLNIADQKIYAIAWDISLHFRDNWQGTGLKGQLVCQSKDAAIKYKLYLDEIGIVSTEVVISPPDQREGEESAYAKTSERVKNFWEKMMNEHGNSTKYEKNIISRFKHQAEPEIIIVVDKLITGFDSPNNTVLYITRNLREHTLLQAIARVNRVHPGKDFGYVVDYYGVLGALDEALEKYANLDEFDDTDIEGTLTDILKEIESLPQKHSEVWDIFKELSNKQDVEAFEHWLRYEDRRSLFYDKVSAFTRALKVALSSIQFLNETDPKEIDHYKKDAAFFLNLRTSVKQRYSDEIDYKQYEAQVQKLIDTHIQTEGVKPITELVNIFDKEKFDKEVEKIVGQAAKADRIASRTSKHINEKMDEDPAFYKKFSEMLKDAIKDYEARRITEAEYLSRVNDIMNAVLSRTDNEIPTELREKDVAKAFYGLSLESLEGKVADVALRKKISTESAIAIDDIIKATIMDNGKPKVDWADKSNLIGKLQINIGDYLIDEVRDKFNVHLSFGEMDEFAARCIDVAKIRYK